MSTVADIAGVLPKLTNQELREVEKLVLQSYRDRKVGIIFDDAYGVMTEDDLCAIQEEALQIIDGKPSKS